MPGGAKPGYIDPQTLSFDAYLKFIEDDFLGGKRRNPAADGRPDSRPDVRESLSMLGDLQPVAPATAGPQPVPPEHHPDADAPADL